MVCSEMNQMRTKKDQKIKGIYGTHNNVVVQMSIMLRCEPNVYNKDQKVN